MKNRAHVGLDNREAATNHARHAGAISAELLMDVARFADYAKQSYWTDPGGYHSLFDCLSNDPAALPGILANLILHPSIAASRGISIPESARGDMALRTAEQLLEVLISRDDRHLTETRLPERRLFVSCRHYALLAASILRKHAVPVRLRAGFATYFGPGYFVDHWVCEYHDVHGWKLLDAELDSVNCSKFQIGFPAHDVPRDCFLSAAKVWQKLRIGALDESRVGVPEIGITGSWFAAASLLRDAAALLMEEMQPWDYWGPARQFVEAREVQSNWLDRLDKLAGMLTVEPQTFSDVQAIVNLLPWIQVTPTVLTFPRGEPVEESVSH